MRFSARILMFMVFVMNGIMTYGQTSAQPRVLGLGAYGPAVQDIRGFAWNPAGLAGMRDWDFTATSYLETGNGVSGPVFHSVALGKRFLDREAIGVEISPGSQLNFVLPPTLSIGGFNTPTSNERRFEYQATFTGGFAHRFSDEWSAGIGFRYDRESVTDKQIALVPGDSIPLIPVTTEHIHTANGLGGDLGILWRPDERWILSSVGRNLFRATQGRLPDSLSQYSLPHDPALELGVGFRPTVSWLVLAGGSTRGTGSIGQEWRPGAGLAFRAALYMSRYEAPFVYAGGIGLGWSYEFLDLEASYVHYARSPWSDGGFSESDFDPKRIHTLDVNPYAGNRISVSVKAMFGNVRESLAQIEAVEMYSAVYPSSFEVFAYRPIGKARVRNLTDKPLRVRASIFVEKYMDAATESQPVLLDPGAVQDIELTAIFNERVKAVTTLTVGDARVFVTAAPAEDYDDRRQVSLLIRGRNEWDGRVESLRFFVQPDDPEVIRASRDMLLQNRDALAAATPALDSFLKARVLIDSFAGKLMYVSDPKQSADYVQYPAETLRLRGGDCDDMTVCFSSLLSSVGISTAFVDVIPPDAPGEAHVYLMFDSGLDPRFGASISENSKRYVIRPNRAGVESIWIPIETTVIARGFEAAWTAGAQRYFDDAEVGLGLARGWVRILDVN